MVSYPHTFGNQITRNLCHTYIVKNDMLKNIYNSLGLFMDVFAYPLEKVH